MHYLENTNTLSMEMVEVREATLDDLPVLLAYEQEIIKAERPFDPTLDDDPISYYDLAAFIEAKHAYVIVATVGKQIVSSGYALRKKAKPFQDHEFYSYLGFMFTDPKYRGMGINAKVVEVLRDWSIQNGLTEIRLTVYSGNEPAIRAYEKVGFKKHLIEMRIK